MRKSILAALLGVTLISGQVQGKDPEEADLPKADEQQKSMERVSDLPVGSSCLTSTSSSSSSSGMISAEITKRTAKEIVHSQLIRAIALRRIDQVNELIDRADVNAGDQLGYTALMAAAQAGNADILEKLIAKGANVHAQNTSGWTALMHAASYGQRDVLARLAAKGASVGKPNNYGYTPLMYAAKGGHCDVVDELLLQGAEVNVENMYGETALTIAAARLNIDVMDRLLNAGSNPYTHTHHGYTPLMLASQSDDFRIGNTMMYIQAAVDRLLVCGVDVNAVNNEANTALIMAVSLGNSTIAHALIGAGANVNHQNEKGETALMAAARGSDRARALEKIHSPLEGVREYDRLFIERHNRDMRNIVKELLEAGADVDLKEEGGQTALQIAEARGYLSIVHLLEEAMKKKKEIG